MLAIRMQRTGRKGHAQFRVIVQDSHFHPTRGRVVSYLGSYDPHTKATTIDKEKANQYLASGAQPSDRVALLLKKEGVKLPDWVKLADPKKQREVRNADKRRSTRPASAEPVEAPAEPETPATEAITEEVAEPAETPVKESPADLSPVALAEGEEAAEPTEVPAEAEPTAEEPAEPEVPAESDAPIEESVEPAK